MNKLIKPLFIALAFGLLNACASTVTPAPAPVTSDETRQGTDEVAPTTTPAPVAVDDAGAAEKADDVTVASTSLPAPKICLEPRTVGRCKARFAVFGFDPLKGTCVQYFYGGCEGSENRFPTMEACNEACRPSPKRETKSAAEPK